MCLNQDIKHEILTWASIRARAIKEHSSAVSKFLVRTKRALNTGGGTWWKPSKELTRPNLVTVHSFAWWKKKFILKLTEHLLDILKDQLGSVILIMIEICFVRTFTYFGTQFRSAWRSVCNVKNPYAIPYSIGWQQKFCCMISSSFSESVLISGALFKHSKLCTKKVNIEWNIILIT